MLLKKSLLFLLVAATSLSCKTPEGTAKQLPVTTIVPEDNKEVVSIPQPGDSLLASIERTACYGTCPIYKFSIYNSGYAVYEGKRFVEKIGKFETTIIPATLEEIKAQAKAIRYFELSNDYPKKAVDFPSVKTSVVLNGKRKDINNGSGAPTSLKEFQDYLDGIKDNVEWRPLSNSPLKGE